MMTWRLLAELRNTKEEEEIEQEGKKNLKDSNVDVNHSKGNFILTCSSFCYNFGSLSKISVFKGQNLGSMSKFHFEGQNFGF